MLAIYDFGIQKAVPGNDESIQGIQKIIYRKFYIDELYDILFVRPIQVLSNFFAQVIDFLVIDLIVEGVGKTVKTASDEIRRAQTGNVGYYIFMMVVSIALILVLTLRSRIL